MAQLQREDKTCLNCRHVVEKSFCPNCGQENAVVDKSFHHLFSHFIEDLVHYDSSFYKTVRTLLFKPGVISRVYISGRRKVYVPPVKLYIFISFLTFFLLSLVVSTDVENATQGKDKVDVKSIDSIGISRSNAKLKAGYYKSVSQLDSIQASKPKSERLSPLEYWLNRKIARVVEQNTSEELLQKFMNAMLSNVPKVLFVYMPFFALVLWLFHSRKWYYFDHGIFTLHYFSFLLLTFSIYLVSDTLLMAISIELETISIFLAIAMVFWWIFYFFRSHHTFYQEHKWVSRTKGVVMFAINSVLIIMITIAAIIYSLLNIK